MGSGYTHCKCLDCFEVTVSAEVRDPEFCWECEDAGCDGEHECLAPNPDAEGEIEP